MFEITSNQVIKIHQGDSSGEFSLLVNAGTEYEPLQYKFYPDLSVTEAPDYLDIGIDSDVFKSMELPDGFHDFEYNYKYDETGHKIGRVGWYYNGKRVDMCDYGIHIVGEPKVPDHLCIAQFIENCSELYFYILDVNADLDEWLVKKTFCSCGEVYTEFSKCCLGTLQDERLVVDERNNMILSLDPEDTQYLMPGEYSYQIKAKLYDEKSDKFIYNTITNRLPLYVVDGEDSMVW